ncbi:hypothetical protein BESB_002050 [Besnoitia besnoiti]|uniref:RING-type E3 ubiquitin transferase n=1 Tax=Besnoitia besnoiti TaxID=94643 RepID=A0A2A9MKU9_BESBE|nr:hypothetical protein BESB_002050 [Besnoitia besnoiti]PFH37864.1 hypothetical protein BESB_002050 [Besnoitia besnoiti]
MARLSLRRRVGETGGREHGTRGPDSERRPFWALFSFSALRRPGRSKSDKKRIFVPADKRASISSEVTRATLDDSWLSRRPSSASSASSSSFSCAGSASGADVPIAATSSPHAPGVEEGAADASPPPCSLASSPLPNLPTASASSQASPRVSAVVSHAAASFPHAAASESCSSRASALSLGAVSVSAAPGSVPSGVAAFLASPSPMTPSSPSAPSRAPSPADRGAGVRREGDRKRGERKKRGFIPAPPSSSPSAARPHGRSLGSLEGSAFPRPSGSRPVSAAHRCRASSPSTRFLQSPAAGGRVAWRQKIHTGSAEDRGRDARRERERRATQRAWDILHACAFRGMKRRLFLGLLVASGLVVFYVLRGISSETLISSAPFSTAALLVSAWTRVVAFSLFEVFSAAAQLFSSPDSLSGARLRASGALPLSLSQHVVRPFSPWSASLSVPQTALFTACLGVVVISLVAGALRARRSLVVARRPRRRPSFSAGLDAGERGDTPATHGRARREGEAGSVSTAPRAQALLGRRERHTAEIPAEADREEDEGSEDEREDGPTAVRRGQNGAGRRGRPQLPYRRQAGADETIMALGLRGDRERLGRRKRFIPAVDAQAGWREFLKALEGEKISPRSGAASKGRDAEGLSTHTHRSRREALNPQTAEAETASPGLGDTRHASAHASAASAAFRDSSAPSFSSSLSVAALQEGAGAVLDSLLDAVASELLRPCVATLTALWNAPQLIGVHTLEALGDGERPSEAGRQQTREPGEKEGERSRPGSGDAANEDEPEPRAGGESRVTAAAACATPILPVGEVEARNSTAERFWLHWRVGEHQATRFLEAAMQPLRALTCSAFSAEPLEAGLSSPPLADACASTSALLSWPLLDSLRPATPCTPPSSMNASSPPSSDSRARLASSSSSRAQSSPSFGSFSSGSLASLSASSALFFEGLSFLHARGVNDRETSDLALGEEYQEHLRRLWKPGSASSALPLSGDSHSSRRWPSSFSSVAPRIPAQALSAFAVGVSSAPGGLGLSPCSVAPPQSSSASSGLLRLASDRSSTARGPAPARGAPPHAASPSPPPAPCAPSGAAPPEASRGELASCAPSPAAAPSAPGPEASPCYCYVWTPGSRTEHMSLAPGAFSATPASASTSLAAPPPAALLPLPPRASSSACSTSAGSSASPPRHAPTSSPARCPPKPAASAALAAPSQASFASAGEWARSGGRCEQEEAETRQDSCGATRAEDAADAAQRCLRTTATDRRWSMASESCGTSLGGEENTTEERLGEAAREKEAEREGTCGTCGGAGRSTWQTDGGALGYSTSLARSLTAPTPLEGVEAEDAGEKETSAGFDGLCSNCRHAAPGDLSPPVSSCSTSSRSGAEAVRTTSRFLCVPPREAAQPAARRLRLQKKRKRGRVTVPAGKASRAATGQKETNQARAEHRHKKRDRSCTRGSAQSGRRHAEQSSRLFLAARAGRSGRRAAESGEVGVEAAPARPEAQEGETQGREGRETLRAEDEAEACRPSTSTGSSLAGGTTQGNSLRPSDPSASAHPASLLSGCASLRSSLSPAPPRLLPAQPWLASLPRAAPSQAPPASLPFSSLWSFSSLPSAFAAAGPPASPRARGHPPAGGDLEPRVSLEARAAAVATGAARWASAGAEHPSQPSALHLERLLHPSAQWITELLLGMLPAETLTPEACDGYSQRRRQDKQRSLSAPTAANSEMRHEEGGADALGGKKERLAGLEGEDQALFDCRICMTEYEPGETIRWLPCLHAFHTRCLARWLQEKHSCPLCRLNLALSFEPGGFGYVVEPLSFPQLS